MMSGARKRQYDDFTYGGTEKKIKAESSKY